MEKTTLAQSCKVFEIDELLGTYVTILSHLKNNVNLMIDISKATIYLETILKPYRVMLQAQQTQQNNIIVMNSNIEYDVKELQIINKEVLEKLPEINGNTVRVLIKFGLLKINENI